MNERASFLAGGGELGGLMRAYDWKSTRLGSPDSWPQSLKTAVRIMLTSRQPIWIGWGEEPDLSLQRSIQVHHRRQASWALGQPTRAVWKEIWPDIGPLLATAMKGDEGHLRRGPAPDHGAQRVSGGNLLHLFEYSPIPDDDGSAGGIICANTDYTQRVIGERQISLLRELAARVTDARSPDEACRRAAEAIAGNGRDLPFALVYLADDTRIVPACRIGWNSPGHRGAPAVVGADDRIPWPLGDVMRSGEFRVVTDLVAERQSR